MPDDSFCVWINKVEGETYYPTKNSRSRVPLDYGDIVMSLNAEFSQYGKLQKLYSYGKDDADSYSFERNGDGLISLITYKGNADSVRRVKYYYNDSARVSRIENIYIDRNGKETPGITIKRTYDSIAYANKDSIYNAIDSVYNPDGTLWTTVKVNRNYKYYFDSSYGTSKMGGRQSIDRHLTSKELGLDDSYTFRYATAYYTPRLYFESGAATAMIDYEPVLPIIYERTCASERLRSAEFEEKTHSYHLYGLKSGTSAYSFTTSNADVATINSGTGRVTLKSPGSTVITITEAADGYRTEASASFTLNVVPFAVTGSTDTVTVEEAGGLKLALADLESTSVGSLTIKGKLNGEDLKLLHEHSGRLANLQELDLSEVTLVPDGVCYASTSYGFSGYNFYLSDADSVHFVPAYSSMFADVSGGVYNYYTTDLGGLFGAYRGSERNSSYVFAALKHVTLPKTATGIGAVMFEACQELVRVNVPESCTRVGDRAFYYCKNLLAPNFKNLKDIDTEAFSLTTDKIDGIDLSHVTSMKGYAFYGSGIKKADLSSLDNIPSHAFYSCDSLSSVKFSPTLKKIGDYAFYEDGRLTAVTLPETVTTIGRSAFSKTSIADINAPASLYYVDARCLDDTPWLKAQTGDNGVIYLGNVALKHVDDVSSLSFREGTKAIASSFGYSGYAAAIKSVAFPSSLRYIGAEAFASTGLTEVTLPETLEGVGKAAFMRSESLTKATWPQSVVAVSDSAFNGCTSLSQVTLPQSLQTIGEDAFYKCTALTQVTLPQSLQTIGNSAFYGCSGLTQITLPEGLKTVGNRAFCDAGLGSVTIPEGVSYLDEYAFRSDALIRVTFNARHAEGEHAFDDCGALEKVTIGPNVEYLQPYLFQGCENLLKVDFTGREIPKDRKASVDSAAFARATPLVIDKDAFYRCSSWTPVIPFGTTSVGEGAFCNVASPDYLWLPYGLDSIADNAYSDENVVEASIPPTLKNVAYNFLSAYHGTLQTVYDYQTEPYVDASGRGFWFGNYRDSVTLYVLPGLLEAYKAVGENETGYNHYRYSYYNHDEQRWNYKAVLEMGAADVPTAIRRPAVDGDVTAPAVYYDLQGRRVNNPKSGLYIVNGRKVVVK